MEACKRAIDAVNLTAKQGVMSAAQERLMELDSYIRPDVFVNYSSHYDFPMFMSVLEQTLPWIESDNEQLRNLFCPILKRWLVFASTYSPAEFLASLKQLTTQVPKFMYFTLPAFLSALEQVSADEQPKFAVLIVKIVENSPTPDLALHVTPAVWDLFQRNTSEMNVLKVIKRFVDAKCGEVAVSVLARKNPMKFTEFVFQKASFEFLSRFLPLWPDDVEIDVLSISGRICEAFRDTGFWQYRALCEIVPVIAKHPTRVEKAAMRPIWKALSETLAAFPTGPKLRALYAGVSLGDVEQQDVIRHLNFESKDIEYQLESFRIGMDFAASPVLIQPLLNIMRRAATARDSKLYQCLLEKLSFAFPILCETCKQDMLLIAESALKPVPSDPNCRNLALRFLNSVPTELLKNYPHLFNCSGLIKRCIEDGRMLYVCELKKLIEKVNYKVHHFDLDWVTEGACMSMELCNRPIPGVLIDLLAFHVLPFEAIPRAIDHLRNQRATEFYKISHDTLFFITHNTGGDNTRLISDQGFEMVVDQSFLSPADIKLLIQTSFTPYSQCSLGLITGSLLWFLNDVYECVEHTPDEDFSLIVMARLLARVYPLAATSILLKILKGHDIPAGMKIASEMLNNFIAEKATCIFASFALNLFGAAGAVSMCPDLCLHASRVDRKLASAFAPFLHQPLPLMPTFLSFVDIEEHKEWVGQCKAEIPKEQWILAEGDEGFSKPPIATDSDSEEEEQVEYRFKRARPAKGISGVFDGTRYSLISYFTHYNNSSNPAEITGATIEEIEQYVFENADEDIRLVIGFFFYAVKKRFHTERIEEWTTKLQSIATDAEMYAVSLFLTSLNLKLSELPRFMLEFISKHFMYIGYVFSKTGLYYAFQVENGLKWFFVRSIIAMDPAFMSDYPLVLAEFADKKSLYKVYEQFFANISQTRGGEQLFPCYASLVSVLFRPQKVTQYRYWPIAHTCLYNLPVTPTIPPPIQVDSRIMQSLIACLQQRRYFPSQFFRFFFHVVIDRQFVRPIDELLKPKTPEAQNYFLNLLPSMYFLKKILQREEPVLDENALDFYENRPPSFALAFYRSLLVVLAPPLPQTLISEVENVLCPVFPEFGYIGLKVWDMVFDETRILSGDLCENPVSLLVHTGRSSISVYNALMANSGFSEKNEATEAIVKLAVAEDASIIFAMKVADAVTKYQTRIEETVCAPGFVDSAENKLNAVLFARRVLKILGKPEMMETVKENTGNIDKQVLFSCTESRERMRDALEYV